MNRGRNRGLSDFLASVLDFWTCQEAWGPPAGTSPAESDGSTALGGDAGVGTVADGPGQGADLASASVADSGSSAHCYGGGALCSPTTAAVPSEK